MVIWIRTILIEHTSYLMTLPDLVKSLSGLYLIVDSRLTVFKKLLKLSGRMDLLLSQISASRATHVSAPVIYEESDEELEEDNTNIEESLKDEEIKDEEMEDDDDVGEEMEGETD